MSDDEWCRDTARDEAVRAAEDAAAVPAIQHRDLPEAVAALTERVARLEAVIPKSVSGSNAEVPENKGGTMPAIGLRTERVTLEVTHRCMYPAAEWILEVVQEACSQPGESVRVVDEADAASDEVVAHRATLNALQETREYLAAANRGIARLTAERDAAIRERDAARAECERLRACADPFNEEMAVIAAWERCAITADWPADEPETAVRCAASMEREIVRLRARVAELEAAASAATILAKIRDSEWSVASQLAAEANAELSAAPAARGWLTAEERDAVEFARAYYHAQTCGMNEDGGWYRLHKQRQLACESLLARSTPPRVKVPHLDDLESDERPVWESACREWIAAIRAAGGEVE